MAGAGNGSSEGAGNGLRDGETEAAALGFAVAAAVEALEDPRQFIRGNTGSLILKANTDAVGVARQQHANGAAGRGVFDRVVEEDQKELPQQRLSPGVGQFGFEAPFDAHLLGRGTAFGQQMRIERSLETELPYT